MKIAVRRLSLYIFCGKGSCTSPVVHRGDQPKKRKEEN
jgi:hypothetical protein